MSEEAVVMHPCDRCLKAIPLGQALCEDCQKAREEGKQDPPPKVSGDSPDLSTEEYVKVFNKIVNEGEELGYHLPAVKDLTPEELVDHINLLSKFATRVRVAKQAAKVTLEAKRIHLSKEEKEALKIRDMQYKPAKQVTESTAKKPRRASGTAKYEDAIDGMMKLMGLTREQAEKRLAKASALLETSEEEK